MLEIKNLNKSYGRFSIQDINLHISSADYYVLLGPSGAGKSVLLEMIAGITKPDSGKIILHEQDITDLRIDRRKTGLIFQNPAIFPHMTVRENIMYGMGKGLKSNKRLKTGLLAEQMGISHLLESGTTKLSGGELQRIALARILASEPDILLLDEPMSAIDTTLKSGLRGLLRDLNKQGLPVLHVTHDYEEAIALANTMAVIENGRIIQKGTPEEIFNKPGSTFVATFSGEHNFFRSSIKNHVISPEGHSDILIYGPDDVGDGHAHIMIRSKNIIISNQKPELSTMNNFQGVIQSINPFRDGFEIKMACGIHIVARITKDSVERLNLYPGKTVWACFKASSVEIIR
ncbi:MAG: ABC transporter ATP-binding protein [Lentimicrobium sp.]|nr:ABC transporter ATP-binding protein [Lentimicrobium sp.]